MDKALFPSSIVETFDETKSEYLSRSRPEIGGMNMNTMLQGTRYVKVSAGGRNTGTESGIFKDLDKITNTKLF